MEWRAGDLIDISEAEKCDVVAFTANSYVTADFRLVMGAGAAKRVRDHFHSVDTDLGFRIRKGALNPAQGAVGGLVYPPMGVQADYHVAGVAREDVIIAAVQVKRHFRDHQDDESREACWALTIASLGKMRKWCERNRKRRVVLNCPLIGLGGYGEEEEKVKAMVEDVLGDADVRVCILPSR